ncbi:BZ3500_MvSof-1268-A1-R1_Chr6-3g08965 [Microbotryum saponariae]|uniref:BZ3500_MvSof-1268-A1-R1_Chr6-3g08965 protein n=1 Tax=Microbotryum saponariae TaxID=289078 RepID=A0A2X0KPE3_9BASI|nr:BZ3500_MvSof-1268-A1-R1_Chr6-3g08965 [Microbotryum saponariae]SDA07567.1 BZ3501_MvSof-1269-A2-R1_Chr6-2g08669 [Microbotryum saponariae]
MLDFLAPADLSPTLSINNSTNARYQASLDAALSHFRSLLASSSSRSWKPLQLSHASTSASSTSTSLDSATSSGLNGSVAKGKGKAKELLNGIGSVELGNVRVHRRTAKGADVVRAMTEINVADGVDLSSFKAVLQTPEVRSSWDKMVEHAHTIELLDPQTRICKTDYRLGWPASPRDTITISKTFSDPTTLIDISTSLPRSTEEPAFLRPAPPYVRSHVHLLAWCIQIVQPTSPQPGATASLTSALSTSPTSTSTLLSLNPTGTTKLRISLFWQWSLKGAIFATHHQQVAQLLAGLGDFVREKGSQIPLVVSYGRGLELSSAIYDRGQETRTIEYSIVADDEDETLSGGEVGLDELARRKERRRLERAVEVSLAIGEGWDVRVTPTAVGEEVDTTWTSTVETRASEVDRMTLRLSHAKLSKSEQLVRVTVAIQRLAGGKVIKVNGEAVTITTIEPRDPSHFVRALLDTTDVDAASSITALSQTTASNVAESPTTSSIDVNKASMSRRSLPAPPTAASEINSLLRRNYIYFTSLLQEPEAKWRHISDSRGVTVTQLNSIDPTLTIYRAEATFVGVGVWDVFSTICTPGARMQWDKTLEDAVLLDDVSELSSLWHLKTKAAWPVAPRDSVTIRTAYKSPSSVHIFSFSTDDNALFPSIPAVVAPTIRTQTDLHGWAIEALSPTTTQITLLDQSDPKGWSNKSWTPTQMLNAVAGVGEFSIKNGGPPVITRMLGAKATLSKYDHDKGSLKTEYRAAAISPSTLLMPGDDFATATTTASTNLLGAPTSASTLITTAPVSEAGPIECEIRCDINTWASSIDVVIDPPPAKVSCLSRHRLSSGGGLWITIEHDAAAVGDDRILVVVKKGTSGNSGAAREKGSVTINGAKTKVDVEMLPEDEVKLLAKRKRVKASPIPLDQYSTHGPRNWQHTRTPSQVGRNSPMPTPTESISEDPLAGAVASGGAVPASGHGPSPLSRNGVVAGGANVSSTAQTEGDAAVPVPALQPRLDPPAVALEALSWLQTFHAEQGPELTDPAPGWAIVSERAGTVVRKKLIPRISDTFSVYRGDRILQGLTADEVASVVSAVGCRKSWDERVDSVSALASYGFGTSTATFTTKPTFPFKGRIFYVASVNSQVRVPSPSSALSTSKVLFCASASYVPDEQFDKSKINPSSLLSGQILVEGWILETLDPYSSSLLAIPSTRCTYVSCVDHAGSIPHAFNSVLNANIVRMVNAVEILAKTKGPLPRLWTPDVGLHIEGPLNDDGDQECVWKLGNADQQTTTVLIADHESSDGSFRSLFRVCPKSQKQAQMVSAVKNILTPSVPVGTILESKLPRSASLNFATPATSHKPPIHHELARKSSRSSLRSVATTATSAAGGVGVGAGTGTPSTRSKSPTTTLDAAYAATAHDLLVAELVIDLKQYPYGYSITCSSSLLGSDSIVDPISTGPIESTDARQVPLRATAHDAPLPSILSASLDSWKRANHLVRVLIPTTAITHPLHDPLLRDGSTKAVKPEWYKKLMDRGALIDLRIVPLPQDTSASAAAAAMQATVKGAASSLTTRVLFNEEKVPVASQKDSKALLARFEDEDLPSQAVKISRVPRKRSSKHAKDSGEASSTLPEELRRPIAVAVRLLTPKPASSTVDDLEYPDPKSPGILTPAEDEGARSPAYADKSSASPVISRRATATGEMATGGSGPLLGILGAYPLSRLGSSMVTTAAATRDSVVSSEKNYSLSFVLVVAIISFLLGSLLRSLLTPADYIIYRPAEAEGQQVERALMQAFDTERRWREARRLIEIRLFPRLFNWDYIVAAVKRE